MTHNCYRELPAWLGEGLATYHEGEASSTYAHSLESGIQDNRLLSVRSLSGAFPTDEQDALLAYGESQSLVEYLIQAFGPAKLEELLAEFRSALDAVLCAIEIQREHAARNAELEPDERLEFRIGIHLGDVRVDGERIYGSGVNIAARLEALASPGGICVSASVHEQVRYHLEVEFHDLGEQSLKNIPHPVRAYALGGPARGALRSPRLFGRLRRWMASSP